MDVVVYAADVGTLADPAAPKFGWARATAPKAVECPEHPPDRLTSFGSAIAQDLRQGRHVAVGFECPLFIPVREQPRHLLRARPGEGPRPWSAGAGPQSLVMGICQAAWTLRHLLREGLSPRATLDVAAFRGGAANLLLWEAFVSGSSHTSDRTSTAGHDEDAATAVRAFWRAWIGNEPSMIEAEGEVLSTVAAAGLWAGLTFVEDTPLRIAPSSVDTQKRPVMDT